MKLNFKVLFILFTSVCAVYSQEPVSEISSDTFNTAIDMFEVAAPMDITLTYDMKAFQRDKNKDEYRDVHFLYQFNDTTAIEHTLRIKPRGQFRKSHCSYAPFWLNIRKADVINENLQEVKKFKVVTQCRGGKDYSDYVLKEFLAYKIYNLLSPVSFRVRLVQMKYVDTGRKDKVTESWAFLIEPESMLAERLDGLVIKNDKLGMVLMKRDEMLRIALFQYLIGNCDFSVTGRHNIKILGLSGYGAEGYTPVPYDFDYAGFVNASYAVPGEGLGIESVTERYYLGPCRSDSEYLAAIQELEEYREEILELVQTFPYLSEKARNRAIAYIESYFTRASGSSFIQRSLNTTCR